MTFKSLLLTTAVAFANVLAVDHQHPIGQEAASATNQTVTLRFQRNGQKLKQEVYTRDKELYLQQSNLSGEIPEAIGKLTKLQLLTLSQNKLTGKIPAAIGNLTNLQNLELNNNQLTGKIPSEIGNLTNLECLYLYNNQLSGEIPEAMGSLTNLRQLDLYNNHLTGEIPESLWALPNLEFLNLHGNAVFGQCISTNKREIVVNRFFSVEVEEGGVCSVTVSSRGGRFFSHFTDDGAWQDALICRGFSFTTFTLPLQALLIAELANYGYAQEMRFKFPNNMGVLTIHPAIDGQPRKITVSERAAGALNALKTALEAWPTANYDDMCLFESAKPTRPRLKSGASLLKNA